MLRDSFLFKLLVPAFFALALGGCETEGPAEEAGENIDRAVEETSEAAKDAGEEVREQTQR